MIRYSEDFFDKVMEYNEKFNDSFPVMLLPDLEETILIEKINDCLTTGKKINEIVDWFEVFDNPEIDG